MADVVLVGETPPSEPTAPVNGDAAVEIAEIEAARDVAIAEIGADTTATIVEAEAAATAAEVDELEDDVEWLRSELADLRAQCASNRETLETQGAMISELTTQLATLTGLMSSLIPLSPSEETPPTKPVQDGEDGQKENPATESPPPAAAERRRRVFM